MQLIDKRESEMSPEEKLKLELIRTLAAGRGFNLRQPGARFDFRNGSNFGKMADFILSRFAIEFKNEKEAGYLWPEEDLEWPNKVASATPHQQPTPHPVSPEVERAERLAAHHEVEAADIQNQIAIGQGQAVPQQQVPQPQQQAPQPQQPAQQSAQQQAPAAVPEQPVEQPANNHPLVNPETAAELAQTQTGGDNEATGGKSGKGKSGKGKSGSKSKNK